MELQELRERGLDCADAVGAHCAGEERHEHPGHGEHLQDWHLSVRVLHVRKLRKTIVKIFNTRWL